MRWAFYAFSLSLFFLFFSTESVAWECDLMGLMIPFSCWVGWVGVRREGGRSGVAVVKVVETGRSLMEISSYICSSNIQIVEVMG